MKPRVWDLHVTVPCLSCRANGRDHRISFRFQSEVAGTVNDRPCHQCTAHTRARLVGDGTVVVTYIPFIGLPVTIGKHEIEYTYRKEVGRKF